MLTLCLGNCGKNSLLQEKSGGKLSELKVSGSLQKLRMEITCVQISVYCVLFVRDSVFMCSDEKIFISFYRCF